MYSLFLKMSILFVFLFSFFLTEASAAGEGEKIWEFNVGGATEATPLLAADGTLYVGNSVDGILYAVRPDGSQKWEFDIGVRISASPALGADGTLYFGSEENKLYAINSDGTKKWEFITESWVYASPTVAKDGTIYIADGSYKLYAINPDGTKKWEFNVGDSISRSKPAVGSDGTLYIACWDGKLYAIGSDGTKRWEFDAGDIIYSSPVIDSDGVIYFGANNQKFYALNSDGSKKWELNADAAFIYSSAAIGSDGTIYAVSSDYYLHAITQDGTLKWKYNLGDWIDASLAIGSDGVIYIGSTDSKLYAINPDGTKRWEFATGDSIYATPALKEDGTLYITSTDSKLYAIETSSLGLANSPWPRYGHDNRNTGDISQTGRNATIQQKTAGLYAAFFNRAPDYAGLSYWSNKASQAEISGESSSSIILKELAKGFATHPVFVATYGSLTNQAFVEAIYKNVLGKEGDTQGVAYWSGELDKHDLNENEGLSRPDMVATFVDVSLSLSITKENFPSLSEADIQAAQERQDLLVNKVNVSLAFVNELQEKTNVADSQDPQNDPAYLASIEILSKVTADTTTAREAVTYIKSIKNEDDPISKIVQEWNQKDINTVIATLDNIGDIKAIAVDKERVFIGNYAGMLYIVDVSDKTAPKIIGSMDTGDIIEGVLLDQEQKILFIANNQKGLSIVDISDANNPLLVKSVASGYARAVTRNDNTVFVASGYDGVNMFNASTYEKVGNIAVEGDYTDSVAVSGDYMFTSDAMSKNITLSSITTKSKLLDIAKIYSNYEARDDITISANTLYVADVDAGLMIFDISDNSNISRLSVTAPSEGGYAFNVTLSSDGTKAYLSDSYVGIDIYDITDKTNPIIINTIDTQGNAYASVLSEDESYLYVADRTGGLSIIKLK